MALSGILVLGGAALVAAAAREGPLWRLVRDGSVSRLDAGAVVALVVMAGGMVALAAAFLLYRLKGIGARADTPVRANLPRTAGPVAAAVAVTGLTVLAMSDLAPDEPPRVGAGPDVGEEEEPAEGVMEWMGGLLVQTEDGADEGWREGPGGVLALSPAARWAMIGALILVGMLAAWWWTRRPEELDEEAEAASIERDRRALGRTVVGSIEAMLADPDPRTAIRGAYARLLQGLEARGRGRRAHEAPMEHLDRVLRRLRIRTEPLHELIELFELARFSTHPLDAAHRDRALRALREVARDLGAPEPPGGMEGAGSASHRRQPEAGP